MCERCGYCDDDGRCQNVFGFGQCCSGYAESCKFYLAGVSLTRMAKGYKIAIQRATGIDPDGR
jgi:hypothetical protein